MSLPQLKDLLKWTLQQMPANDGETEPKDRHQVTPEDIAFISGAMEAAQAHEKAISSALLYLISFEKADLDESDRNQLLESIEILQEFFEEHPGNSDGIERGGLIPSLERIIHLGDNEVTSKGLELLSIVLSNNVNLLESVADMGLLVTLFKLYWKLKGTDIEQKVISTISASIRHCEKGEKKFLNLGGVKLIDECVGSSNIKCRERGALLLYHFVQLDKMTEEVDYERVMRNLTPLVSGGIQYCETCAKLFGAMIEKKRDCFKGSEAMEIVQEEIDSITKLVEEGHEGLEHVLELLKEIQNRWQATVPK